MKADAKTENEVIDTLKVFMRAYRDRDLEKILELFAPDPDVVFYGNGEDEKSVGLAGIKEQAEHDWSQSAAVSLEIKWTSVSMSGPVAWLAADLEILADGGGVEMSLPARLTAVLERRSERWFFMQWHVSLPTREEGEGNVG
ncbi:nuclear transport factor 2 family protein [Syntrophorhabdus aromaticivorans]|uniref:Nuclear transport factor 2 family protein n=1 Tax=Syntrophorhabdus aromaticivorans TaxID=328301 RepID=A0A971M477_9BACT|nr:nuclear transport factor 2 family protein [Syntrophorhabdus aromaticivorans]NLW35743.1 nuclear transport factor 2 family protein [Syntrophorhabdus aromaticivorans]